MNSLFTPYYFESEQDANTYMSFNWPNQKFHLQIVEKYIKPYDLSPTQQKKYNDIWGGLKND